MKGIAGSTDLRQPKQKFCMKQTILKASRESGKILRKMFWDAEPEFKDPKNIVTEADRESEKTIVDILSGRFPEFNIIAEESGRVDRGSDYTWVIDPLDGTTNFSIRNPFFCSAIALARGGRVVMSAVNAPFLRELYFAEKGGGALLNGERISVSGKPLERSVIAYCSLPHQRAVRASAGSLVELRKRAVDVRRMGSAGLELCYVAAGRIEGFYMLDFDSPWDAAAGSLMVSEAGGRVTNLGGREWSVRDRNILASNRKIHGEVLEVLREGSEKQDRKK
jgi:myo-inositol-1(or 4)-monophosphatase